jgi:hypothetical protein
MLYSFHLRKEADAVLEHYDVFGILDDGQLSETHPYFQFSEFEYVCVSLWTDKLKVWLL